MLRPRLSPLALLSALLLAAGCGGASGPGGAGDAGGDCDANPSLCGGCADDRSCTAANPRCDLKTARCVACLPDNDNCPTGSHCAPTNNGYACMTACRGAADCPKTDAGTAPECCGGLCVDTTTDPEHCGTCDKACAPVPNGKKACVAGACVVASCDPGFEDCDHAFSSGCEVNTVSDVMHCGACGKMCPGGPNGSPACSASACVFNCNMGYADCDHLPETGCEARLDGDLKNCGACGNACPSPANATIACLGGACAITACVPGNADCDLDARTGCEANVKTDPANCGGCGRVCPAYANAAATCAGGSCALGACNAGYANCDNLDINGCETPTATDAKNCGACARACSTPNGTPACQNGACVVGGCNAGYADCDKDAITGCESQPAVDVKNCGACGKACPQIANGTGACMNGQCVITGCKFGYADCDKDVSTGCEASLLDVANCGACKNVCPAPPNAAPGCNLGQCGLGACNALYGDCDGNAQNGCEKNLASDTNNCGACGKVCALANANAACLNGACGIVSCAMGYADCDGNSQNGCESRSATDVKNCGACGNACPTPPNTTPTCSGTCGYACVGTYVDCDKNAINGCEINAATDVNNCGACAKACPAVMNGTPGCAGGVCGVGACNMPFANCDNQSANGCESNGSSDANNCGGCGKVCNLANANNLCLNGQCGFLTCKAGFADCDMLPANGCEVNTNTSAANCGACGKVCPMATPTCSSGTCVASIVYSESFPMGTVANTSQQCVNWNSFRQKIANGPFTSVTVKGTYNQTGLTCTGAGANTICTSLGKGMAATVTCNGHTWYVDNCVTSWELAIDLMCTCGTPGYEVIPCDNSANWGGVNTNTCGGPAQTMTVICQ